jgi:ABC-2 type transport system ATP-binding protein
MKVFPRRRFFAAKPPVPVLHDVSLWVPFGEVVGIMGANGAGKTTLLEIIAMLLEPTSGEIAICGHDTVKEAKAARACLGYSGATGHAFYARMSARQNLELFAVLDDLRYSEAQQRAAELLEQVGLAEAQSRQVETFSEGMRQRLSLARALIADPRVLLLDEPTRSVDRTFRHTVHELLRRRVQEKGGRAVVLVTHSLAEVEAVCDRVYVLDKGTVVRSGSARAVRAWDLIATNRDDAARSGTT